MKRAWTESNPQPSASKRSGPISAEDRCVEKLAEKTLRRINELAREVASGKLSHEQAVRLVLEVSR